MAIDLRTLGSKLAKYRGQLKESIVEVASSTGIDASRLAAVEDGQAEPTGDERCELGRSRRQQPHLVALGPMRFG